VPKLRTLSSPLSHHTDVTATTSTVTSALLTGASIHEPENDRTPGLYRTSASAGLYRTSASADFEPCAPVSLAVFNGALRVTFHFIFQYIVFYEVFS